VPAPATVTTRQGPPLLCLGRAASHPSGGCCLPDSDAARGCWTGAQATPRTQNIKLRAHKGGPRGAARSPHIQNTEYRTEQSQNREPVHGTSRTTQNPNPPTHRTEKSQNRESCRLLTAATHRCWACPAVLYERSGGQSRANLKKLSQPKVGTGAALGGRAAAPPSPALPSPPAAGCKAGGYGKCTARDLPSPHHPNLPSLPACCSCGADAAAASCPLLRRSSKRALSTQLSLTHHTHHTQQLSSVAPPPEQPPPAQPVPTRNKLGRGTKHQHPAPTQAAQSLLLGASECVRA